MPSAFGFPDSCSTPKSEDSPTPNSLSSASPIDRNIVDKPYKTTANYFQQVRKRRVSTAILEEKRRRQKVGKFDNHPASRRFQEPSVLSDYDHKRGNNNRRPKKLQRRSGKVFSTKSKRKNKIICTSPVFLDPRDSRREREGMRTKSGFLKISLDISEFFVRLFAENFICLDKKRVRPLSSNLISSQPQTNDFGMGAKMTCIFIYFFPRFYYIVQIEQ